VAERIIISDTANRPHQPTLEESRSNQIIKRTQVVAFVTDTSVTFREAYQIVGRVYDDGRVYTRWRTTNKRIYSVRTLKSGEKRLYVTDVRYSQPGGRRTHWKADYKARTSLASLVLPNWCISPNAADLDLIGNLVRKNFDFTGQHVTSTDVHKIMYPALYHIQPEPMTYNFGYSMRYAGAGYREKTVDAAVRKIYGKTRYRKDLMKAFIDAPVPVVDLSTVFTGLVPIDWQIDLLKRLSNRPTVVYLNDVQRISIKHFRTMFSHMTDARKRSVIRSINSDMEHIFRDTCRLMEDERYANEPQLYDCRTIRELHDKLVELGNARWQARYPRVWNPPNAITIADNYFGEQKITPTKEYDLIDSVEMPGLKFKTAKEADTMHAWSDEMHNCIRSYVRSASNGSGIYIGIYKEDDVLVGNIELSKQREGKYRLSQILGKYNQHLPAEILAASVEGLKSTHLIDELTIESAWGIRK